MTENIQIKNMSKKEKKNFLSMDLIERMIRVEQKISATFNKPVYYKDTEYYKSLPQSERAAYEEYLRNKKKKKSWWFVPLFVLGISLLFGANITGRVTGGYEVTPVFNILIVVLFVLIIGIALIGVYNRKQKNRMFNRHIAVLDKVYLRRSVKYNKNL